MEFEKNGTALTVRLIGEVTSDNTPKIVETLFRETDGINEITFDLKDLDYISSSGLRMLIALQKLMKDNMVIKNANEEVMRIFEIAGFTSILNFG
ncbi:MAG: STAS domain-containing protein [Ruminiclostridium sp.]|nr:STAS domain-containing protein [Ruminiclostridium sp.]